MKIVFVLGMMFLFGAYVPQIHAGSLNKYADEEPAPRYDLTWSTFLIQPS